MSFSRRKFLRSASLLSVTALFPIRSLIAKTRGESLVGVADANTRLTHDAFARNLHTDFTLSRPYKTSVNVKLVEVNDLTPPAVRRSTTTDRECFVTVFFGTQNTPLSQETYSVTHASLGTFDMFVVPVGKNRDGVYYEAVFNRLHG